MTDKVMVGYVYNGGLDAEFVHCLDALKLWDEKVGSGYLNHGGDWKCANGGTSIPTQRNNVVQTFLGTDCDWLWFIDTDETFDPDILERLMKSADAVTRPLISGLVMAYRPKHTQPIEPACALLDDRNRLITARNIPAGNPWEVAAVGAGCLFVHRSVYEKVHADAGDTAFPWFQNVTWHREDDDGEPVVAAMGEDFVFSLRAGKAGFPILVDTDIQCGHRKVYEFTANDFWRQVPAELIEPRTYVVIPVKDQRALTESLLNQLAEQGGADGIFVLDNDSGRETRRYLARQTIAEVLPAPGYGIHQMWNLGALASLRRWPKVNLAFLNNDLILGPDFLTALAEELRDPANAPALAVSPNYDGRDLDGFTPCDQICANRYDGTGGAPGFAFMVKGEIFRAGYLFPEDAMWWFGDNDLLLTIRAADGTWGLTPRTTVEHVRGGGQTGDWDNYRMTPQFEADQKAFLTRWTR